MVKRTYSPCASCGMADVGAPKYHPHLACLAFRGCRNGNTVEANLEAVVRYGMRAQAAGLNLEQAMNDIQFRHGENL